MIQPGTPAARAYQRIAKYLLMDLESGLHEVVLVPAPEPRHSGHQVRALQYANAAWYSDFAGEHCNCRGIGRKRMKRPRTFIRKDRTASTLQRMIAGDFSGVQAARLIDWIDRKRENHRYARPSRMSAPMEATNGFDDGIMF
jgi:hypothetical protein